MGAKSRLRDNKHLITSVIYQGKVMGFRGYYDSFRVIYSDGHVDYHNITEDNEEYTWLKEHSVDIEVIKEQNRQEKLERKEEKTAAKTPVRTRILDGGTSTTTTKAGGVGRAIAGGIVAGPVGAVVGAATAGHKTTSTNYTIFKVWYQDGHSEVEQVEHGTAKYKKYLELIED